MFLGDDLMRVAGKPEGMILMRRSPERKGNASW